MDTRRSKSKHKVSINEITSVVLAMALTGIGLAGYLLYRHQRMTSTGLYRASYEGRVVNKSVTFRETKIGSSAYFILLIKSAEGQEFEVLVGREVYEEVRVGMSIKKTRNGLELDGRPVD
jgi:hypothetical protein